MKTGYPFLKLSQKYNLDYSAVLIAADYMKKHPQSHRYPQGIRAFAGLGPKPETILKEIDSVNYEFASMQAGFIDWQAGHEIKEAA